jgi:DNA-binding response OmpR family regulator
LPPVSLIWAQNGKEVFSELAKCSEESLPFLISLDFNMPLLNGLQALKKLKETDRYKNIPAVVYSSSINERHKNEVLESGAAAYLVKGTSIEEIEQDVRNMLMASPEISNSFGEPKG